MTGLINAKQQTSYSSVSEKEALLAILEHNPYKLGLIEATNTQFTYMNKSFLDFFQTDNVESLPPWRELWPKGFVMSCETAIAKGMETKKGQTFTSCIETSEGKATYFQLHFVPLFNANDTYEGFIIYADDITQIKETKFLLENTISSLPGVVCSFKFDAEGNKAFTYMSSKSEDILGEEPETILEDASITFDRTHEDDMPALMAALHESAFT